MKSDEESSAVLGSFERKHNLFAFKTDGWSAWRVMRNPVHGMLANLKLNKPASSNVKRALQALIATVKLLWILVSYKQKDVLIKTCRSGLRMPLGENFRDVYFDGLLQCGYSYLKLEEINSDGFEKQAALACFPSNLDPVVFTFWGRILGKLFPADAKQFCSLTAKLCQSELNIIVAEEFLLMRVSTVYWQSRLYTLLLKCIKPKVVFVSDTGEYALRVACARQGIRFIELQHGNFYSSHGDAIPSWVEGSAHELVLPDVLACKGDYWINELLSTRQGNGIAHAVGNELIDIAREQYQRRIQRSAKHIVLTSQGLDTDNLILWVSEMIAAAPAQCDWILSIKLHPTYDDKNVNWHTYNKSERVKIISGSASPNIYDLLADADLHLSISSACHFDALAIGVPSMVIPLSDHEIMLGVVDSVNLLLAVNPADVWSVLALAKTVDRKYSFQLSKPNFVENLQLLMR